MATPRNPLAAFIWGAGGAALTPEELAQRREVEDALLAKQGIDTSPVGHWTQGLARVANAAAGAYRRNKLEGAQTDNDTYNKSLVETLLGRSGTPASSGTVPGGEAAAELASTDPASGVVATGPQSYRDAIASIESAGSGDYAAIGPTHDKLGRALGRYQVMEANIPQWSKEALGREVTADEFLADPALQDAIFDKRFGDYVAKYGPEGAAQAWFGGEGGVGKTGRKDVLGTTIGGYGQKFLKALGPQEVANIDPAAGVEVSATEGVVPVEGASLADEVAQFAQPADDTQLAGRDAVAKALMDQQSQINPAQAAITDQVAALPATGLAQGSVTGAQPVEMAQATTGQQGLSGIPTEDLLRVLTDPRANANTRAVAEALMQQQETARRQQVEQQTWMQRQQYEEQRLARDPLRQAQIEKMQREAANPNSEESFFGNPVAVQNQDGSISYGQIGNRGSFKPIQLGEGQSFAPPTKTIDGGTENLVVDQAGNVIARMPKNLAEAESQKVQGKAQGEAAASLPADMQQAETTISQIDNLLNNKGLDSIVGPLDQYRGKTFLGGEGRDALARLEQLQGGAFLQAYGLLKGGGQITEIEGIKAERAMARMDRALDEADFKAALRDFREAVSTGVDKMRQKAGLPARGQDAGEKSIRDMTDEELEALANGQ